MFKNDFSNVGAVILAAGKGTRIGATDRPKVMFEIGGKPMVAYIVETLEGLGFTPSQICLVVGFQKQTVMEYFGDRVTYAVQEEQLGTGHAVAAAASVMKGMFEHVMPLYGDLPFLAGESIRKLIEEHVNKQNTVSLATVTVPNFEGTYGSFLAFGRIVRDDAGKIIGDVEYKDATEEQKEIRELNVGYYVFRADWLWEHLGMLETKNVQGEYYLTDLIHMAIDEGKPISSISISSEEAVGVNTKEDLQRAHEHVRQTTSFI